jgi:hypothetical protein
MVAISRYFSVPRREEWPAEADPTTRVIAGLRNGAPLVLERDFGKGRVVVVLTTAAPEWNNWARNNPSFVVAMLDMQAFLSRKPQADRSYLVGQPLALRLDPARYAGQVRFEAPRAETPPEAVIDAVPDAGGQLTATFADSRTSGIYRATLTRKDGTEEVRGFAYNVEGSEGDLGTVTSTELAAALDGVAYKYDRAATFRDAAYDLAGNRGSQAVFYVLLSGIVLLLIGEQLLAYWTGYHPPSSFQHLSAEGGR